MNPRYKTLAELKAALENGELPPNAVLWLDNDSCWMYDGSDECLYEGPGYELREEALTLLGISWSHV